MDVTVIAPLLLWSFTLQLVVLAAHQDQHRIWDRQLALRAPRLSGGDGKRRKARLYGDGSNYGRCPKQYLKPLSERFYYEHFRFERRHIPRLARALRMPASMKTKCGCRISGEEALLIYLKKSAYPSRLAELKGFFGRSSGAISEICTAVRAHLVPLAHSKLDDFDHEYLRTFARLRDNRASFERLVSAEYPRPRRRRRRDSSPRNVRVAGGAAARLRGMSASRPSPAAAPRLV